MVCLAQQQGELLALGHAGGYKGRQSITASLVSSRCSSLATLLICGAQARHWGRKNGRQRRRVGKLRACAQT